MIKANIILDKKIWNKKIKNPDNYFKKKLAKLSKLKNFKNINQEFTVLLTNNKKMRELNTKFRNKKKETDVLSFPLKMSLEKETYIGDIAISFEIINKRSKYSNFNLELDKMWIHGYLHLVGFDHQNNLDHKIMTKKEIMILKKLNRIN
tara:strand:+ start:309 stop:755 length:447 start_codon:yes stop_codon:yes gene_type:complete